ncbi:MAG: extracellular solute-binding protein [Candidatus Latescibacterota bacterium]
MQSKTKDRQRPVYTFSSTCLFLLCAILSFSALSSAEEKILIVSPHWEGIQTEFERGFEAFSEARTGERIGVEWLDQGGTSAVLRFVKSEFVARPEGIGIDMMFGGGVDPYLELRRLNLTHPYRLPEEVFGRIAQTVGGMPMYDPAYHWYGATLAGFGIIYNKSVLDMVHLPRPKSWEDLGDPSLLTWVGSADPRSSGSVHTAYEIILQAFGWERGWEVLTRLGANVRNFTKGADQSVKDVAVGEVAYGLAIDFYAWAQVDEVGAAYIGYTMPENLTIVNPDAIAILKGAPHLKAAQLFLEFVMSEPGQKLWMLNKGAPGGPAEFQLNRFSVIPSLYEQAEENTSVRMNPFNWESSLIYDSEKGSARWRIINDLVGVLLVDSHRELVRAWKQVIELGLEEEDLRKLCALPVTESEAEELVAKWEDPEIRNRTIAAWTVFARSKYGAFGGEKTGRGGSLLIWASLAVMLVAAAPYGWSALQRRRTQRWILAQSENGELSMKG